MLVSVYSLISSLMYAGSLPKNTASLRYTHFGTNLSPRPGKEKGTNIYRACRACQVFGAQPAGCCPRHSIYLFALTPWLFGNDISLRAKEQEGPCRKQKTPLEGKPNSINQPTTKHQNLSGDQTQHPRSSNALGSAPTAP